MKRLLTLTGLVLAFVLVLAACAPAAGGGAAPATPAAPGDAAAPAAPGTPDAPVGDDVTTFTFWTFVHSHADYFHAAAELWNERNPDRRVAVDAEVIPFSQMHQNLQIALQAGTGAPDLVDIEVGQAEMFLNVPTPPLLPQNDVLAPYMHYLVYSRVEPYSAHGNYYGVCYHIGAVMMFYNQSLFDQAGLDWRDIVTWDDFIAMGQEMKERTGVWMTQVDVTNVFYWETMVSQQHSQYVIDGAPNVNSPEAIRAMQLLHDMIYVHGMARVMVGYNIDSEEFYADFNNGGSAAVMAPAWYMGRFINQMPDLAGQISVGPVPVFAPGNNRSSSAGGTMTSVTNQIDPAIADLALEFVAFAKADYHAALMQWTLLGFDPVRWDVFADPAMRAPSPAVDYFGVEFAEQLFDLLFDIQAETAGIRRVQANAFEIRDHIVINVKPNVIGEPLVSPADALNDAQATLSAQFP
jgi:arabinosaccharide transport system substrate-binding protein